MVSVSIITATLNRMSLKECCESVNSQTFKDWHHYIIGDGVIPIDHFHEQRTTFGFSSALGVREPALNMPDGTPNPILRWALQHLELGEFVCFLDDDNLYCATFLEKMINALLATPEAGVAICPLRNERGNWQEIDGYPEYRRCDNSGFVMRSPMAKAIGFPHARPDRECVQDYEFIRACAESYGWVRVPEQLAVFGSSPNYPSLRGGIKVVDSWDLPLKGMSFMREGNLPAAITTLRNACELDPQDAWALWHLGEALLCAGETEETAHAWALWRVLIDRLPHIPDDWTHYCYALASFFLQDPHKGMLHLNEAIDKANGNNFEERVLQLENEFNLGLYWLLAGSSERALHHINCALASNWDEATNKNSRWKLNILNKCNFGVEGGKRVLDYLMLT